MDSSKTKDHNSSATDTTVVATSSPAPSPTQDTSFENFINSLSPLSQDFSSIPDSELSQIEHRAPSSDAGVSINDAKGIQEIQESSRTDRSPALHSTELDLPTKQNEHLSPSPSSTSTSVVPQSNNAAEPSSVLVLRYMIKFTLNHWLKLGKPAENEPRNVDPDQSDLEKKIDHPERKKKKTTINESEDSSNFNTCKCKKIRCLSQQCTCFRKEYYCNELCSCQDFLNNAANENTVVERKVHLRLNRSK